MTATQVTPERKPEWIHAEEELRTACFTAQEQNRTLCAHTYGVMLNRQGIYEQIGNEACAIGYYLRGRSHQNCFLTSQDAGICLGVDQEWCQGFNAGFQGYNSTPCLSPDYLDGRAAGYRLCQQFKPKGAIHRG
jgi:hypothetical protein